MRFARSIKAYQLVAFEQVVQMEFVKIVHIRCEVVEERLESAVILEMYLFHNDAGQLLVVFCKGQEGFLWCIFPRG